MSPLALAYRFMEIFYESADPEQLSAILHEDLEFTGPFYRLDSARAYIDSLLVDPPREMSYRIIHAYQDAASACLIYQMEKPGISTPMAQQFTVKNGKIHQIRLIFDSGVFIK